MATVFTPSNNQLGDRTPASVRADVAAFMAWVKRFDAGRDAGELRTATRANYAVLFEVVNGSDMPIARVVLRTGRWQVQWADRSNRWHDYDEQSYLTLAIPMRLIEEDASGVFWG